MKHYKMASSDISQPAVVIDNGSGMMKAGIAGDEAPKVHFPSVVGYARYDPIKGAEGKEFYVGQEAIAKRGLLNLEYPLENGIVKNWDQMSKVWYYTYNSELKIESSEQPVLLTEAPLNPKENREKMVEMFFETFKVPAFYVYTQAVLAMYASGRTTGAVVDSGDGVTHIVVVYDGFSIKHAVTRMDIAGRTLTDFMFKYVAEDNVKLVSSAERDIAKDIKERLCYCPLDFEAEMKAFETSPEKKKEYTMPDGQVVKVGSVMIRTPEVLFQPKLLGIDTKGVHEQIVDCIKKTDVDLRRDLYENLSLSGGTTMIDGLSERLTKEVSGLVSPNVKVKILSPAERKYSIWIGGSVLSTLATFQSSWITTAEFEEAGPSIVHRKCY